MRHCVALSVGLLVSLILVDAAAAYYSPSTGRFLSRDPLNEPGVMLASTRSQGSNFIPRDPAFRPKDGNTYAFVRNQPTIAIDPVGLEYWDTHIKKVCRMRG
jgi:hypothetical protein